MRVRTGGAGEAEGVGEAVIDEIGIVFNNPLFLSRRRDVPAERLYKVLILLLPISQPRSNKRTSICCLSIDTWYYKG